MKRKMDLTHKVWLGLVAAVGMVAPILVAPFDMELGETLFGVGIGLFVLLLAYDGYQWLRRRLNDR